MTDSGFVLISLLCIYQITATSASLEGKELINYHDVKKNWKDAQAHCRLHHLDLVTINDHDELNFLNGFSGWIGMYREDSSSEWKWSSGKQPVPFYINVRSHTGNCVYKNSANDYFGINCKQVSSSICFDYTWLFLVEQEKTWEEALAHCRALDQIDSTQNHRFDLASLTTNDNREHAHFLIIEANTTTQLVWTGLRFLGHQWKWVGGENYDENYDVEECEDMGHCGALEKKNTNLIVKEHCKKKYNFFCYKKP